MACLALGAAFHPLFDALKRPPGDIAAHVRMAQALPDPLEPGALVAALLRPARSEEHRYRALPGFQLLVLAAAGFSRRLPTLLAAAIVVLTAAAVAKFAVSVHALERELRFQAALPLALVLTFLAPITLPWGGHPLVAGRSPVHLGQVSGLIIHNPTTIAVFPLSILLFVKSWQERLVASSLLAAGQCLIKPNFVLAWMPAFVLMQGWRHGWGRAAARNCVLALGLPVLVLAFQYRISSELGQGFSFAPLLAWREHSPNIPLSVLRSIAFPALFAAVYWQRIRRDGELWFAWAILAVATLQYALLVVDRPGYRGDWSWGRYLAVYNVFLVSLARFARHAEWSWPAGRGRMGALNALLAVLLLLHLQTGLWYYARGVRHGDW